MDLIQHFLNFRPEADWIINQSGIPYLEIDMYVPYEKILEEWSTVEHLAVHHRTEESLSNKFFYGHKGWKSLVIYGKHYTATTIKEPPLNWTEIAKNCPTTVEWIKQNWRIDETTGRIRFMYLEPGGFILPHNDRENKKIAEVNVAITNPTGCIFRFKNYGDVPFAPGKAMMMDISNQHMVFNSSINPRLHIIVHADLIDKKLVEKSYAGRYYN